MYGTIQAFLQYTKNFTRPINEIAQQYSSIQTAIAGAERVFEIMDTEPESDEGTDKDFSIDNVRGDLMFKDIDFSYVPGEKVLHDFDLWIKSGQKLAIVGATGSGKTTVVNLLTRFYDIDGGSITLIVDGDKQINSENGSYKRMNGELYGAYNIVQSDTFESHSLCPVYLTQGTHRITLQTVKNSVSLDKITVKNTEKAADKRYSQAGTWISGKDVNTDRIELMDYLKSIYGRKTLTAQAVTPNTNTEIDAIVKNTGRFPAIRASDLRYYTASGAKLVKNNTDIQLSQEWAKNGGIVSYAWYWYTPIGKTTFYREESTFDIGAAVSDYEDLAVMNEESLAQLLEDETISEECYAVLSDMDAIAKQLSVLKDSGVTVLFRPLPASSAGLYWWEKNSKTYKWLWQTMHRRFDELYGLSNLLWIYTADIDPQMFPGDDYVDIVGCDVYDNTDTAHLAAMYATDSLSLNKRMLALTECAVYPDPDIMARDNAMWLWTAMWNGKYLINESGELTGDYISVEQLKKFYNHEATVTRDEIGKQKE